MLNPFNLLKKPSLDTVTHRAVAGDTVVAEASAEEVEFLEGNVYFPPEAVDWDRLERSDRTSVCPWKGVASYYDVVVDGERRTAAAWTQSPSYAQGCWAFGQNSNAQLPARVHSAGSTSSSSM